MFRDPLECQVPAILMTPRRDERGNPGGFNMGVPFLATLQHCDNAMLVATDNVRQLSGCSRLS